jgi:hypothetical protein
MIVFAIILMVSSDMVAATIVSLIPWLDATMDIYFSWFVGQGVSFLAMVPRRWHV